jgi:hypothetical protein
MKRVAVVIPLVFFCIASAFAYPLIQEQGRFSVAGLNDDEVEAFFVSFGEAIATGDKKKVASLMSYPIKVNLRTSRRQKIGSSLKFIQSYDRIFNDEFKAVITKTDVKDLWAKSSGVAMPRGEVWFSGIAKKANRPESCSIKIITINGPIRSPAKQ